MGSEQNIYSSSQKDVYTKKIAGTDGMKMAGELNKKDISHHHTSIQFGDAPPINMSTN
jgi:hypothetical protein